MSPEPKFAVRQWVGTTVRRQYVDARILACYPTRRGWRYKVCFTQNGWLGRTQVVRSRSERRMWPSAVPTMSTDPVDPVDPLLARARAWTALCGACDADLPMSCTCPIGDPRQVIADLVNRLAALTSRNGGVTDMATTGHVPPPTSEPRNII
jgi:hypothetical protein